MISRNRNISFWKSICYIIFVVYFLFLMKIVLFKYIGFFTVVRKIATGHISGFRTLNLIPLASVTEFANLILSGNFTRGFNNIFGNILVFAPMGYFLPLLFKKCKRIGATVLTGFIISFLFETCQYLLYLGSADIDDIILNLIGTILGFGFYQTIKSLTEGKEKLKYTSTIVFSIIGFFVAGYLAIDYFGVMFGIQDTRNLSVDDTPVSFDESQIHVDPNDEFDIGDRVQADSNNEFYIEGIIVLLDDESITINMKEVSESVAVLDKVNPNLITVKLLPDTKFSVKDIYDTSGSWVDAGSSTKNELNIDDHISISGYKMDDELFATEIIINNFFF